MEHDADRDDLIKELKYLRKGPGVTLAKLSRCPALLSVSGATRATPQPAQQRITQALDALAARRSAQALRAALNLHPEHHAPGLEDRRKSFAPTVVRGTAAVKNWEDDAIDELALLLLGTSVGSAIPTTAGEVPSAYVMLDLEIVARYDKNGCFNETVQTRRVLSLVDHADGFIYATHVSTRLEVVRGGHVVELDRQPNGAIRHKIMYPQPIQRGESTEFVFREYQVDPDQERPVEDKVSQLFHIPTRRFWVQAQFAGDTPRVAWTFDKMTYFERPGTPTDKNQLKVRDNKITAEFVNLHGGLASGVAWRW